MRRSKALARYERPLPVKLIDPEKGTTLASETVKKYGDNGKQWYAAAISADKIRPSDLILAGVTHVGIVDAGCRTQHRVLTPFFWRLPITFPNAAWELGSVGYNYVARTADPSEDQGLESHGTHITGLVTARGLAQWLPNIKSMGLEDHIKVYALKIADAAGIPDFTFPNASAV